MKNRINKLTVILVFLLAIPMAGLASDGQKPRRKGPPPEAIKACEGKTSGDSVTFTGRRGETLQATCRSIDGQLAAVPNDKPPRGDREDKSN